MAVQIQQLTNETTLTSGDLFVFADVSAANEVKNITAENLASYVNGLASSGDDRIPSTTTVGEYVRFTTTGGGLEGRSISETRTDLGVAYLPATIPVLSDTRRYSLERTGAGVTSWVEGGGVTDFGVTRGSLNVNVNDRNGGSFVLQPVSTTEAGVMAAADFVKLNSIETNADVTDNANVNAALGINTATGATDMVLSQRGTFVSVGGNLPDAPAATASAAQYELEVLTDGTAQWAIAQGAPGTPITVDTVITDGSTNPVTNNAIFNALALKEDAIGGFTNTQDTITETLFGAATAPRTLFNVDTADTTRLVGSTFEWMGTTYTVTMGSTNAGQVTFTPTLQDTIPDDTMLQFVFQTWTNEFVGTVDIDTLRFANGSSMTRALVLDDTLSATSENALENRAINTALDAKQDTIGTYSENYLGPIEITAQFPSTAGSNQINHSQSVNAPEGSVFTFMGTNYTVTSSTEFSITFTPNLADAVPQLQRITLNRKNTASIDADLTVTDTVNNLVITPTGIRFPDDTTQTTAGTRGLSTITFSTSATTASASTSFSVTVTSTVANSFIGGGFQFGGETFTINSITTSSGQSTLNFAQPSLLTIPMGTSLTLNRNSVIVNGELTSINTITAQRGIILGGTGAANTLSDYEEGTWTPSLDNFTGTGGETDGTNPQGTYTKIGNLVQVSGVINIPANTLASTGVSLLGLPFTPNGTFRSIGSGGNISVNPVGNVVAILNTAGEVSFNYFSTGNVVFYGDFDSTIFRNIQFSATYNTDD